MKKNILFFDLFLIILVIGCFTFYKEQTDFSSVEKRYLEKIPRFSFGDYIDGKYQETLEKAIADQFVFSEDVKLNYDKLFDFSTAFDIKNKFCANHYINAGINRSYYGCKGNIVFAPISNCYPRDKDFLLGYNKLNNIVDTYYYIVDTSTIFDFEKNKYSCNLSAYYKSNLKGNYTISGFKIKSFKEYSKYFYKTDHHWNYKGSYKGYKEIMKMLGINDIRVPKSTNSFNNIKFYGSHDQQIRKFDTYDDFYIYEYDLPEHDIFINGIKKPQYGFELNIDEESIRSSRVVDVYAIVYGYDYGEILFDYKDESKDNLLIISNSLDNPIDELIASHFNKTFVWDSRFYEMDNFKLDNYIKENNISKALIISDYFYVYDNIQLRSELFTDGF